jgi:carbonic anhydrase/acetyltransferase-like protein (isoleucine patch superfamily)
MLRSFRSVHPKIVPPGSLVMGVPGNVRRPLTPEESASIQTYADHYVRYRLDFEAEVSPA